jgi:pimeloyl-ACP methyl ester carboxylesterase
MSHSKCVAAILEHECITKCVMIGHSMGGTVALLVALNHPKLVSRLIMSESNIEPGGGTGTRYIAGFSEDEFVKDEWPQMMDAFQKGAAKGVPIDQFHAGFWSTADPRGKSCLALPCLVLSCLVLSCLVLSCLVLSYGVSSCLALCCVGLSPHVLLCCAVLCCIVLSCCVVLSSSCLVLPSPCLVLVLYLSSLVVSCLVLFCLGLSCLVFVPLPHSPLSPLTHAVPGVHRQSRSLVNLDPLLKDRWFQMGIPRTFIIGGLTDPRRTGQRLPDTPFPSELTPHGILPLVVEGSGHFFMVDNLDGYVDAIAKGLLVPPTTPPRSHL